MSPTPDLPHRQRPQRQIRPSVCWLAFLTVAVVVTLRWEQYLIQFAPVATGRRMVRSSGFREQLLGANVLAAQGPAARAAVPDLLALCQDQDSTPIAVSASIQVLARILPRSPEVVDAAVAMVRRKGFRPHIGAGELVRLVPHKPGAEPALLSLLGDKDQLTRVEVAKAMAFHSPWSVSMRSGIAARLEVETDPSVREALESLVR